MRPSLVFLAGLVLIANPVTGRELIRENHERCQRAQDAGEETVCDERNFRVFVAVTGDGTQLRTGWMMSDNLRSLKAMAKATCPT